MNGNDLASNLLASPEVSYWLKDVLRKALERDPVDAARDAALLMQALDARADELLSGATESSMGDAAHHQTRPVVLDDGLFYIELDSQQPSDVASGFLQHRCYPGVTTPNGYECVGRVDLDAQAHWAVSIDAPYREDSGGDRRHLGAFADRLDAIAALWGARHDAHCRHQAD